jgi:hypothetical protein
MASLNLLDTSRVMGAVVWLLKNNEASFTKFIVRSLSVPVAQHTLLRRTP